MILDTVMKGVLVFLILVVSISIISEYICLKTIRIQENSSREQKIDAFLADLKKKLMDQQTQEKFESYKFPPEEILCQKPVVEEVVEEEVKAVDMNELTPLQLVPEHIVVPKIKKNIGQILPGFEPLNSFAEVSFS